MTDRACPLGLLILTVFVSGLIWVYAIVANLPVE